MVDVKLCLCTMAVAAMPGPLLSQESISPTVAEQDSEFVNRIDWRRDLEYLAAVLPRVHANAYHTLFPGRFAAAVNELGNRFNTLPGSIARVELAGLVAKIGDGHTRVNLLSPGAPGVPTHPDSGFVPVPLDLYAFADGFYVRGASEAHGDLVGARVLSIGIATAEEAAARVAAYMHHDNDMTVRLGVPWLLVRPAFLHAAGLIDRLDSIRMEFELTGGQRVRRELRPLPAASDPITDDALFADIGSRPLWLRDNDRPYWFTALDDGQTLYVQFNAVVDAEGESLGAFARRLGEHLKANNVKRVVVDLRHNGGGNFVLALPLVDVLDRFDDLEDRGALFVLIGRATFSAAGVFAALVEERTDAVFVGEPTGAKPNTYGDLDTFSLPSSELVVAYSKRFFQPAGPYDVRPWIDPDVTSAMTFAAYAAGRDPALEAVAAYQPTEPLADLLVEAAKTGTVDDALALYREFREQPTRKDYWAADDLIALGVHYWRQGPLDDALPVWQQLANDYPEFAEGAENLAETYTAIGDRESAISALMTSLEIDPRNPDAIELVSDLCGFEGVAVLLRIEPDTKAGRARLRDACGGEPIDMLDPNPGARSCQYQEPDWHPGGKGILFSSNRTGDFELYSITADGGPARRVASGGLKAGLGRWSPDGSKLAFVSNDGGTAAIYVMDADGTGRRRLTPPELRASSPMWAPSGDQIAFEARGTGNADIFVIDVTGAGLARLTDNDANDFRPTWSPDGRHIAFQSKRGGTYQIYVMEADGRAVRPLTRSPGNAAGPRWSPDGLALLFMSDREGDEEIYRMAPDGSQVVRLTDHVGLDYAPAWSPDGGRIAFVRVDEGRYGIWVMNRDGSGPRLLLDGCLEEGSTG